MIGCLAGAAESAAYREELAVSLARYWSLNQTSGQSLAELRRALRDAKQELRWIRQDFVFLRSASELAVQVPFKTRRHHCMFILGQYILGCVYWSDCRIPSFLKLEIRQSIQVL